MSELQQISLTENCACVLGARGSVAVSGGEYAKYGGATTCIAVRLSGQLIVMDAGSGILRLPSVLRETDTVIPLLLSHPHTDHLLGLLSCPVFYKKEITVDCYAAEHGGMKPEEQIGRLFSPPLWPVGPEMLPAGFRYHTVSGDFSVGDVTVKTMEGCHPGGVSVFRLECGGKSVVLATDCTLREELLPRLAEFAADCDLLFCDGQYSDAEWAGRKDFGHSTWTSAARLGVLCRAKQMRIVHHDPGHGDAVLDEAGTEVRRIFPYCSMAYEGEVILL